MHRILPIAACASLLLTGGLRAQEADPPRLQLVVAGQEVALPAEIARTVAGRMETIVGSSNFDSVHQPDIFPPPRTPPDGILRDSYLRLTYGQAHTFHTVGGLLAADRIEAGLTEGGIPGPWLLRAHGAVIELAKYSGQECVHLARLPGFTEHLPGPMREKLPAFDRIP